MDTKKLLTALGILALAGIAALNFDQLKQIPSIITKVQLPLLLLAVATQLVGYLSNAKFYQSFFATLGHKIKTSRLYQTALAINFVNQAFPSGGISGMSYISRDLNDKVPGGQSTLVQLGRYAFTYVSFLLVMAAGFLLLFLAGEVNKVTVRVTLIVIMLVIGAGSFAMYLINDREKSERYLSRITGWVNWAARSIFRKSKDAISKQQLSRFTGEFYAGYSVIKEEKGRWKAPFAFSLAGNLAEVATLYAVFIAFGVWPNPGVVIGAYTLANIVSLASMITGGVGLFEASMVGALVALGQPLSLSFSIVIIYRVLNMAVFLPLGFYYYRKRI